MKNLAKYTVKSSSNIRIAIKQMDISGIDFIAIIDDNNYVIGVVTDGDLR